MSETLLRFLRDRPLIASALVVTTCFAAYFSAYSPHYMSLDDMQMAMTVGGQCLVLESSPHIQFSHILIGSVLHQLYQWHGDIAWYGWYLIAVHFLSHVAIAWSILIIRPSGVRLLLYLACFVTVGVFFLNHLQFTMTSFLCGVGGVFLLTAVVETRSETPWRILWPRCAAAVVLLMLASLIRWHGFLFVLVLTSPLLLSVLLRIRSRQRWGLLIVTLAGTLAVAAALRIYDRSAIARGSDWTAPEERRQIAKQFFDYHALPYGDDTRSYYDAAGWSQNDFRMLMWYCLLDEELYSIPRLNALLEHDTRSLPRSLHTWLTGLVGSVWMLAQNPNLAAVLACTIACLLLTGWARHDRWTVVLTLGLTVMVLFVLLHLTNHVMPWVVHPAGSLLILIAAIRAGVSDTDNTTTWRAGTILAVALIALSVGWSSHVERREWTWIESRRNQGLRELASLDPSPDELYLLTPAPTLPCSVTTIDPELRNVRMFFIGPPQLTPNSQAMLASFNISDPLQALYQRDDVFLICPPRVAPPGQGYFVDVYRQFVREHYGMDVALVAHFPGEVVYIAGVRPLAQEHETTFLTEGTL